MVIKERFYLDKSNPDILYDQITTYDHSLTKPWTIVRTMRRGKNPIWVESICAEGNVHVEIAHEQYMLDADGLLAPMWKGQPAPNMKNFTPQKKTEK